MNDKLSIFTSKRKEEFTKLLNPSLNKLYRIAYSFLKDKDKASDALQDSTLSAFKNFHTLKDIHSFEAWITSILVNRCKEILRRDKKIIFTEYAEVLDTKLSVDEYENLENNMLLITLLDTLNDRYKEVIKLKYFGDLSIREISIILNIPEGTVKSRLNYGLNSLRKIVNEEEVEQ